MEVALFMTSNGCASSPFSVAVVFSTVLLLTGGALSGGASGSEAGSALFTENAFALRSPFTALVDVAKSGAFAFAFLLSIWELKIGSGSEVSRLDSSLFVVLQDFIDKYGIHLKRKKKKKRK
jgi:hypothetical protein